MDRNLEYDVWGRYFLSNLVGFYILWSTSSIVGISPHQIVVPWPDYSMLLVEVSSCLCHAHTSGLYICLLGFFNCINLYVVAISHKLCCSISNRDSRNMDWLVTDLCSIHTCIFPYYICSSVVVSCSWHERLKTHGNTHSYGITQIACCIYGILALLKVLSFIMRWYVLFDCPRCCKCLILDQWEFIFYVFISIMTTDYIFI